MDRVTSGVEESCKRGLRGAAVRLLIEGSEEFGRQFKELVLQAVIDRAVVRALGKARGLRRRGSTPWKCPRCGPRRAEQIRRNGHYRRRPLTLEGPIELKVPQLVCLDCGRSVPFEHALLPRRQRLWLDLEQRLTVLYLEGMSYRGARRFLERTAKTSLGLMSLWRALQRVAQAPHAAPPRAQAQYLGVDEVYQRIRGQPRWFLTARAQTADGAKHYVGSVLSQDRSIEAWEVALTGLGISRYNPPFAVLSDGDRAIEEAVLRALPGVRLQRCTWHLKHNAAEWIKEMHPGVEAEGQRRGLMAAVHAIVDAPSLENRSDSLDILAEAVPWLANRLRPALARVAPKDANAGLRTNNLMERGFREYRRRTRPMDGFKSVEGASNFYSLWMHKENARCNGRDYLPELIP